MGGCFVWIDTVKAPAAIALGLAGAGYITFSPPYNTACSLCPSHRVSSNISRSLCTREEAMEPICFVGQPDTVRGTNNRRNKRRSNTTRAPLAPGHNLSTRKPDLDELLLRALAAGARLARPRVAAALSGRRLRLVVRVGGGVGHGVCGVPGSGSSGGSSRFACSWLCRFFRRKGLRPCFQRRRSQDGRKKGEDRRL